MKKVLATKLKFKLKMKYVLSRRHEMWYWLSNAFDTDLGTRVILI